MTSQCCMRKIKTLNIGNKYANRLRPSLSCRVIPFTRNEAVVRHPDLFATLETLLPPMSDKTQIALQYAYRLFYDHPTYSVLWVHADAESAFTQDFKFIARKFNLDTDLDDDKLLIAVRDRIEAESRWLLVLGNADDTSLVGIVPTLLNTAHSVAATGSKNLHNYIPRGPNGIVLWISRDERIVGALAGARRGIQVARITNGEATELLATSRNEDACDDDIKFAAELLEELQWLPLAISPAGAYMQRTSTPIKYYLAKLTQGRERWRFLNDTERFDRHRRPDLSNSILETWNISITRIRHESEMAYILLHVISYVDNQDIPLELFMAASAFIDGNRQISKAFDSSYLPPTSAANGAVNRLKQFSFISRTTRDNSKSYEMSKLVQEALRYNLNARNFLNGNREDEAFFSNAALQVITGLLPNLRANNKGTWAQCEKYLAHGIRASEYAEICNREVETSHLMGRFECQESANQKAYEHRKKFLSEKHPQTVRSLQQIALTCHSQGRIDEAENVYTKILALRQETLEETHPDTRQVCKNMAILGHLYCRQSGNKEAEKIVNKASALQLEVLGQKYPDTISGRCHEAEEMVTKGLAQRREALGEKHPSTIRSTLVLESMYHKGGLYKKAEEIFTRGLDYSERFLATDIRYYCHHAQPCVCLA
ncbi:hypothetical protein B0H63DRAFT_495936 [Podospora didyma]|uniref:Kinesin light chain n=1 Tax=Podospora didyma TaxID=330526 RepID=A0AAE0KM14_9PEZI|nr:hypothetical protein B0H63DRAFT_495936 [Podospora didyma]